MNKQIAISILIISAFNVSSIFTSTSTAANVTLKNPTKYLLTLSAMDGFGTLIEPGKTAKVHKGQKIRLDNLSIKYQANSKQLIPPVTLTTPADTASKTSRSNMSIEQDGKTVAEMPLPAGKKIKFNFFQTEEFISLKSKEFTPTKDSYTFDITTNSFK
jgi:hypothetical protein